MAIEALILLIVIFFLTSVVGVVTGSNSLIAVPAMFQVGIDPKVAVATNMFGLVFMAVGGTIPFVRQRKIEYRKVSPLIVLTIISSAIGAMLVGIISNQGIEEMDINIKDMMPGMFGNRTKKRKMRVDEAMEYLISEEESKLVDMDQVSRIALERVESHGIIFLDEIDKIAGREGGHGPDVSREGVQRDILPIVEGTTVNTKYGIVRTDHILFIAAGAFHVSKPSDLIPELQGRFPIRVELQPLTKDDFKRILTEPKNALLKQYRALMETEGINLEFKEEAIETIADFAFKVNETTEDIGAPPRRRG